MEKDQLPERLRNIPGLRRVTGERVVVHLKEQKMKTFESIFIPIIEQEEFRKDTSSKEDSK
ncbi:hypothetical protein [Paenibacillus spongiae]|uniref:Uncharacterized protein n=1 Tax=Paenibacillus spongiae TaxID=2909671 RepID=A0ABY5SB53_9BACL|nr:hypothetical protein [Paenibacillus spongiae]UVI31176.1 hypothetical protein L1F29_04860 [Paenibacillus spongiae]